MQKINIIKVLAVSNILLLAILLNSNVSFPQEMSGGIQAIPAVDSISIGHEPKEVLLTSPRISKELRYSWSIPEGSGHLEGDPNSPSVKYVSPESIIGNMEIVYVKLEVLDGGEKSIYKLGFTIQESDERKEVRKLLTKARAHQKKDNLKDAIESYIAALKFEPDNAAANKSAFEILETYKQKAAEARNKADDAAFESLIHKYGGIMEAANVSESIEIKKIAEEIELIVEDMGSITEFKSLMKKAELYYANRKYVEPPGKNAFDIYKRITEARMFSSLDAIKVEAKKRIIQIKDKIIDQAKNALDNRNMQKALNKYTIGKSLLEYLIEDLKMRQFISQKRLVSDKIDEIQNKIDIAQLVKSGDGLFQKGIYFSSDGENAFNIYKEILSRQPRNRHAQSRLLDIIETTSNIDPYRNNVIDYLARHLIDEQKKAVQRIEELKVKNDTVTEIEEWNYLIGLTADLKSLFEGEGFSDQAEELKKTLKMYETYRQNLL